MPRQRKNAKKRKAGGRKQPTEGSFKDDNPRRPGKLDMSAAAGATPGGSAKVATPTTVCGVQGRPRKPRDPREFTAEGSGDLDGKSVHGLGTDWAPLDIPWRRRLQTFAVLVALTLMPITLTLLVTLFFLPSLRPYYTREMVILFLIWTYVFDGKTPSNGGRPLPWLSGFWLWRFIREYYPARLVVTEKLDPTRQHMFGLHPHGIIGAGMVATLITNGEEARKALGGRDYRVLTVTFNFLLPLWRDIILGLRFVSASRASARAVLEKGLNCMIVVGGAREALDARPGHVDLTLKCRSGFVRLALQHGARLVPVFTFGENELWTQIDNAPGSVLRRFQMLFRKFTGFTLPMFRGRGIFQYRFGIMPHRRPVHTVVGRAIEVPLIKEPTKEQIKVYQGKYIEALEALYNEHRPKYEHPRDHEGKAIASTGFRVVA